MKWLLSVIAMFAVVTLAPAEDKKPAGPVTLKLVAKKSKYTFDGNGMTPKEYKAHLEKLAKDIAGGQPATPPKPLPVDFVLQITNTSKEEVTVYVGGDPNVFTFNLTGGAGVVNMLNPVAFTADFRLPKAVAIAPGKSYEIPVKVFADGNRGYSRLVFWTGPGDYKLSVKYTLSDKGGGKGTVLTSEPVKITVAAK